MTIVLVRLMTPRQYGTLAIATTITTLLAALANLGLTGAVEQGGSRAYRSEGLAGVGAAARRGLAIARRAVAGLLLLSIPLLAFFHLVPTLRRSTWVVAVLLPPVILAPVAGVFRGMLRALFASRRSAIADLAGLAATAIATTGVLLAGGRSAMEIGIARSVAGTCVVGALIVVARPWISALRPPAHAGRHASHRMLPLAIAVLMTTVAWQAISQMDVFFVGAFRGAGEAGLYAPISRMADFTVTFSALIGSYLLAGLARAVSEGAGAVAQLYHWASRWSIVISSPLLAVLIVSPTAVLRVTFGPGYGHLGGPTRLLGIAATIQILFGFNGLALTAYGRARPVALAAAAGLVTSVIGCPVLIPLLGLEGAALSTLIAIAAINVVCSALLWRGFRIPPWNRAIFLTTLALAAGLAVVRLLELALAPADTLECVLTAAFVGLMTLGMGLAVGSWRTLNRASPRGHSR